MKFAIAKNEKVTRIVHLPLQAGNTKVFELHGSVHRNYCEICHTFYDLDAIMNADEIPLCKQCGGIIKPDVVLYEEGLDEQVINGAIHSLQKADLLIVAGTSLTVYPAASLLRYFKGEHIILINHDETFADQYASVLEGSRNMIDSALHAEPLVPIEGTIEFQELTEGNGRALEFLQTMQALDNFRLGCHGVPNGGLWDKASYVNTAQTELNMGGADVSLKLQDSLTSRQTSCTIINSIWGLGAWCEPNEVIVNMDLDGDGVAYERNEGENSGGTEDGSGNETNV